MKGIELIELLENVDPAYIEAAAAEPKVKKFAWLKKYGAIAACIALVLSAGLGTYAYAAEAKEYKAAIRFFNEYDLSVEGLTRGEIKNVYRDITSASFSYEKTAEVIANSLHSEQILGFEILQEAPTPGDLEYLWNYRNDNGGFIRPAKDGVHYEYRSEYTEGDEIFLRQSYLEKYDGETLLWSAAVSEFAIRGYSEVSDGVLVYGTSGWQNTCAWLAKLDENGALVWKKTVDHGFEDEYIAEVLENADGSYAVISRGDYKYFCLSQCSAEGRETHCKKTEVGNYGIWNAARFGDGYIVQLGSYMTSEYAALVKVDREGNITGSFSYGSEDSDYYIADMIEFNGDIYLSTYAVPAQNGENAGSRGEIAPVLQKLFANDSREISGEELTPLVRENYTAVLLVCDPLAGTPREFYSVEGSLGGTLSLNSFGRLLWDVESIATTFYSPTTNAFTIGGTCQVFRYTFDDSGTLVSQEKTDEFTNFLR